MENISDLYDDLVSKKASISVTGLGYVGLPLALALAHKFHVIGYDRDPDRIASLKRKTDPNGETNDEAFDEADITFTAEPDGLNQARLHIVATPTPVNASRTPDLSMLTDAMHTLGRRLKRGDVVSIESTVYPGCTEETCLPILQAESGLHADIDFGLAYSPERINPGDKVHTIASVTKIVAARTDEALAVVARTYGSIVEAGVHRAPSIKVAEAAKIIENTQRDVNIALMNELSLIFGRMGIDTADVIEAASTKWNFMPFHPGLVGGHCIGVDPYYIDYKAREVGYHTQIINRGRYVNDNMGRHVAREVVKRMAANGMDLPTAKVLLMGLTYKANVSDVRNTRCADIADELKTYGIKNIDIVDPLASKKDSKRLYGITPTDTPPARTRYEAIIVAVAHDAFKALGQDFFSKHMAEGCVVADVLGIYKRTNFGKDMWRL